ncbi:hypothetical protein [Caulobacter sp. 17J65-9]|uniref:hypothetical protein n=1 Tax=Caulobacter sp. 17J65-9 TaxID=2709382 RepID=UPI0013C639FF|nr:hypothetical protein [Caulobacter sp. 17J65-9]NEX93335.1 hypothetical protein [Caulobacter sp. 17J65-9]
MKTGRSSLLRVFAVPALIAALSAVGLVAALLGDGVYDVASWVGLGAPVAAVTWAILRRRT